MTTNREFPHAPFFEAVARSKTRRECGQSDAQQADAIDARGDGEEEFAAGQGFSFSDPCALQFVAVVSDKDEGSIDVNFATIDDHRDVEPR